MKTLRSFVLICTLASPTVVLAQDSFKASQWDFVAPSVYNRTNLTEAASGLIVYDSMTDSFYAKGPAGSTDWRSFSTGPAFVGTQSLGTCTTAMTVDWSKGSVFTTTLTSSDACAFSFTNVGNGQTITLWITNGASGGTGTATWSGVKWPAGTAPTITTGTAALDICTFTSNGTAVAGSCVQNFQ